MSAIVCASIQELGANELQFPRRLNQSVEVVEDFGQVCPLILGDDAICRDVDELFLDLLDVTLPELLQPLHGRTL